MERTSKCCPFERNNVPLRIDAGHEQRLRIGVVTYLNTRPLTFCLPQLAPNAELVVDLPSRLADGLAAGRLDVAVIPSIEYFRHPGYVIVSDACVACDGPVRSVKLYGRVPVSQIRTLALDEGSRTSAALSQVFLKERFGLEPEVERLPIGSSLDDTRADAILLIGDRGILPVDGQFEFVWDLGEEWRRWTGLPFVFAMWIARPTADLESLERLLTAARDEGTRRLREIAQIESPKVGITEDDCLAYFCDNLRFRLGPRELQGLEEFSRLAVRHAHAPMGVKLAFHRYAPA